MHMYLGLDLQLLPTLIIILIVVLHILHLKDVYSHRPYHYLQLRSRACVYLTLGQRDVLRFSFRITGPHRSLSTRDSANRICVPWGILPGSIFQQIQYNRTACCLKAFRVKHRLCSVTGAERRTHSSDGVCKIRCERQYPMDRDGWRRSRHV